MDVDATNALIAGLSGVGGAAVGAGGTILVAWRIEKAQAKREHNDAALAFWTAAASFGSLWSSVSELLPADANLLGKVQQRLQISGHASQLIDRQFAVTDAFWHAMGRVRMVATRQELDTVSAVEQAVVDWKIGHPTPDAFGVAIRRRLRVLVESLGPDGSERAPLLSRVT